MQIKRLVLLIGIFIFMPLIAIGDVLPQKILAVAQSGIDQNTIKNKQEVVFYSLKDYSLFDDSLIIKKGEKLVFILSNYNNPTIGKRDGSYNVIMKEPLPTKTNYLLSGTIRIATPNDIKGMAGKAGITVAGKILKIPGFSQAVAAAKGVIKPGEEGRLKTVEKNVFESTPLSYVEKGKDFKIGTDVVVAIKLKNSL